MFTNYTYVYATTGTNTSGVILQEKFLALFKLQNVKVRTMSNLIYEILNVKENGNQIYPFP